MAEHEEKHGGGEGHGEHGGEGHGGGGHGGGGHGGGHEEHEEAGAPEWLISFADNVALMMGFFVILLAMNMGPKGTPVQGGEPSETNNGMGGGSSRADDIIISIREGFNSPLRANSGNPNEARLAKIAQKKQKNESRNDDMPSGTAPKQQSVRDTDFTNLGGFILFEDNSDALTASAQTTLQEIADRMKDQRWIIEVRGSVSPFESGKNAEKAMSLSYNRSLSAGRALARYGIPWAQLRLVACGDANRKVARSNDHTEDRPNQRVEIIVTRDAMPADPYAKDAK